MTPSDRYLSPPDVARRFGISAEKVVKWINTGELPAVNVAQRRGGRPRWRISPTDLLAFENARAAIPDVKPQRRRRTPDDVIKYF